MREQTSAWEQHVQREPEVAEDLGERGEDIRKHHIREVDSMWRGERAPVDGTVVEGQ